MTGYFAVFEYTEKAGGYKGVRTYSRFESKKDFESQRTQMPSLLSGEETVIYDGTDEKHCRDLVGDTPTTAYIGAAFESARMPDGTVDSDILEMHLMNIGVVLGGRAL